MTNRTIGVRKFENPKSKKFIGSPLHTDVKQQLIPWQPNEDVKNTQLWNVVN